MNGSISTSASAIDKSWTSPVNAAMNVGISYSLGTSKIGTAEKARIDETIANLTYASAVSTVEESVTLAYINLQNAHLNIETSRISLNNLNETLANTKERYESGYASELDVYEAELAVRNSKYGLKALMDAYELSLDSFRILTGITDDEIELSDIRYTDELTLPGAEELMMLYSSSIISVQSSEASIDKAESNLKSAKISNYYPSVSFSAGWDLTGNAGYTSNGTGRSTASDNFYGRITVSVPISSYIPGSNGNNSVKNAEDNVEIAKLQMANAKQSILSSLKSDISRINQQSENISIAEESLAIAEKTLELRRESYNAGLSSLSDLLSAENRVLSARLTLDSARLSKLTAIYNLCFDLGISRSELEEKYSN